MKSRLSQVLVRSGMVIHMLCAPLVSSVAFQVSAVVQIGVFVVGSHSLETQSATLKRSEDRLLRDLMSVFGMRYKCVALSNTAVVTLGSSW